MMKNPTLSTQHPTHCPRYRRGLGTGLASIVLGLSLIGGAIAPCRADGAAAPIAGDPDAYRIAPGDSLEITVLNETDLNRTATVLPDGRISYPFMGEVKAAGLSVAELTHRIAAGLSRQVARPQVTVTVSKRREEEVGVLGAVKEPGKRVMGDNWHVLDLLLASGGLSTERPEWVSATLVRGGGAEATPIDLGLVLSGNTAENRALQPGDVLLVQERDASQTMVQVLGEVAHPGRTPAPRDGSIVSVLLAAGGPTEKAALSKATIIRAGQTIPVDLRSLMEQGKAGEGGSDVTLQPGDTLVVPQNKLWFAVFGAVGRPGAQPYPDDQPLNVVDALSQAGGQSSDADLKHASLVTPSSDPKGKSTTTSLNLEDLLRKGDMARNVAVPPGSILYVPGKKQGGFGLRDALGLLPIAGLILR